MFQCGAMFLCFIEIWKWWRQLSYHDADLEGKQCWTFFSLILKWKCLAIWTNNSVYCNWCVYAVVDVSKTLAYTSRLVTMCILLHKLELIKLLNMLTLRKPFILDGEVCEMYGITMSFVSWMTKKFMFYSHLLSFYL